MAVCEFSYKKGADDTVRCQRLNPSGDCCCFVKFCHMTGHWQNNDTYKNCPVRKSGLEEGKEKTDGRKL